MTDRGLLTAYWIESEAGPWWLRRLGVSAYSLEGAFALLTEAGLRIDPASVSVRENVRVADLGPRHVVPNMGVIVRRGVWYPNVSASP